MLIWPTKNYYGYIMITKLSINEQLISAVETVESFEIFVIGLLEKIKLQDDHLELTTFLCHRLIDCNDYIILKGMVKASSDMAEGILLKNPSVKERLEAYLIPSEQLISLMTMVETPSLKERVKIAKIELDNSFIDPITLSVMECPVTYSVNNVKYTVDLYTLLNSYRGKYALKCPFTRKYILLSDLTPCPDYVSEIMKQCSEAKAPLKEDDAIKKLCSFIRKGDIMSLEKWRGANPYIDCSTVFKDPDKKLCTPLHFACITKNYPAAIWLLNQGALLDAENAAKKTPLEYLNSEKLEDAINADNNNSGLKLLLALYNLNVKKSEIEYNRNISEIVKQNYAPALYWHGIYMRDINPKSNPVKSFNDSLELLCKAEKYGFYRATYMISYMLKSFLDNNPSSEYKKFLGLNISEAIDKYTRMVPMLLLDDVAIFNRGFVEDFFIKVSLIDRQYYDFSKLRLLLVYGIANFSYTRRPSEIKRDALANLRQELGLKDVVNPDKRVRNSMS